MPFKSGQSGNPKGRAQGSQNKITRALKESILQALEEAGGNEGAVGYLRWLAHKNPPAFASLLGKVLPMTVASTDQDSALKIILEQRIVRPQHRNSEGVRVSPETDRAITVSKDCASSAFASSSSQRERQASDRG
jgi:hypothetical protein